MWCEWPLLDGSTAIDEHVCVEGWAYCEGGLEDVLVLVDGERHSVSHGLTRGDVDASIPGFDGHVSGFLHVLDTRAWTPGSHELTVVAVGRDGTAMGQRGTVVRGPDLPYRVWRQSGGGAPTVIDMPFVPPDSPLSVCVLKTGAAGAPLAESLESQTHPNWRRGERSLAAALGEIARGGRPGVIVEDSGFLHPSALVQLDAGMAADAAADVLYADEDAVAADGGRSGAFLKPGWSPELLLSTDYVGPLVGLSPRAARAALEAAHDPPSSIYDVLLRLVDAPVRVERVPAVLFTSQRPRVPCDDVRARGALERLGARRGQRPRIRRLPRPGTREVSWEVEGEPLVSVLIPTSYSRGLVRECLRSIRERSTYGKLELVIVDSSEEGLASGEPELDGLVHRVVSYVDEGEFNYSKAVNAGARAAQGDYLVLLNDDTEVRSEDWVQALLAQAQAPGVGVVGCRLVYPDGRIQHGGVGVHAGLPWHLYLGFPGDAPGYRGMLGLVRNCSAVTAACMLVGRELFAALDGLDESLVINFADTDFCLRAVQSGQRVVWTPHAELVHHERSSFSPRAGSADVEPFTARWSTTYADGDPYYHRAFMPSLYYELRPEGASQRAEAQSPLGAAASSPDAAAAAPALSKLEPLGRAPGTDQDIAGAIGSGRPAMWCDEPELDKGLAAFGVLRVSGWAYAKEGIEVFVYLDGQRHLPRMGMIRDDLSSAFGEALRETGFSLLIDLDAHRAGRLELVVAARAADGTTVGVRGEVDCRPAPAGVRAPETQHAGTPGDPTVPDAGDDTGERFIPEGWRGRLISIEHEARYRWAEALARDRDVLDVACGVGYGTSILVRAGARRVLGVDFSDEAVEQARNRVGDPADFLVGDLLNLPCKDDSFDLITCFETIEHVADPGRGLDELRRVLRPGGVLLLSSPNRDVYIPGNPFHLHEYTPDELEDALSARFAQVRLLRQQNHLGSLICGDDTFTAADLDHPIDADMRKGVAAAAGEELYTVAAASDAPLPSLPSLGVLGEVFDVKVWYERALAWEERALVTEARAQARQAMQSGAEYELERVLTLQADLLSSLSWRVTKPLRTAKQVARWAKRFRELRDGGVRRLAARGRAALAARRPVGR